MIRGDAVREYIRGSLSFVDATELARLRTQAEEELREPERWGTTFTLLQSWGRVA